MQIENPHGNGECLRYFYTQGSCKGSRHRLHRHWLRGPPLAVQRQGRVYPIPWNSYAPSRYRNKRPSHPIASQTASRSSGTHSGKLGPARSIGLRSLGQAVLNRLAACQRGEMKVIQLADVIAKYQPNTQKFAL